MAKMRVVPLFETPVYVAQLEGHVALNHALRATILTRRDNDPGVSFSNVRGWQSSNDMTRWGGAEAQRLAADLTAVCDRITAQIDGGSAPIRWRAEMWANVNEPSASNQNHWHPGSYLSAVYYVDDGYAGSTDGALGGELVFLDPRMPFLRMRTPDLRHIGADGTADEQETWMRPRSGLLVVFPSFLGHSVREYRGNGIRISVAINMVVTGQDG